MKKSEIMKQYPKNLTRRFNDGDIVQNEVNINYVDPNISKGIANHMTITVKNKNTAYPLPFALIPANFDTLNVGVKLNKDTSGAVTDAEITKDFNDVSDMNKAGFVIGGVACDGGNDIGSVSTADKFSYTCASADPARKIKQFLDYLKLNPVRLKNIEIVSSNANAFDTNMMLTYVNPFFKNAEQQIDLSVFYSLYQEATDRVRVDVDGKVELSDLSLLTAVIPANTEMKFIMRFE